MGQRLAAGKGGENSIYGFMGNRSLLFMVSLRPTPNFLYPSDTFPAKLQLSLITEMIGLPEHDRWKLFR